MLKGVCVLAMVLLHLFDRPHEDLFTPVVFLFGTPLSFYIAQLSDFCVFGFAFCSGYGHMCQCNAEHSYRRRLKRICFLLADYWVVLASFSIIGIVSGHGDYIPGSWFELVKAFLTLHSYNGAWWYLQTYIVLVIISQVLLDSVFRFRGSLVLLVGGCVYIAAYLIRFKIHSGNALVAWFGPFGMTLFEYMIGCVWCKGQWFSRAGELLQNIRPTVARVLAVLLLIVLLYIRTKVLPTLFVAPISGMLLMSMFHLWNKPEWLCKTAAFFGRHSTNIWLTHMFFFSVLFRGFAYIAKYPLLILLFLLGLCIAVSYALQLVQNPLKRFIGSCL